MRAKIFLVCSLLFLGVGIAAFMPPQKAAAAGERYEWQGANITADLGVFTQGPGNDAPFEFGPGDRYYRVNTIQRGSTPLLFGYTTTGDSNFYSAGQTWEFLVRHRVSGEFRLRCTFDFRILVTAVNQQGTPGSGGAQNIYSLGTISVSARSGSITQGGQTEDDQNGVCSGMAEHYDTLTQQIEIRGTAPDTVTTSTPPATTNPDPPTPSVDACAENAADLGLLVCPMQDAFSQMLLWLDERIIKTLRIETQHIFAGVGNTPEATDQEKAGSNAFRIAWSSFRTLAYALLVILGLIMIVSQIVGLDLFDAYTIRKMLPRLALAAIFIPLLWPLLALAFNMANDAAYAVWGLIFSPFQTIPPVTQLADGTPVNPPIEPNSMSLNGPGWSALTVAIVGVLAFGFVVSWGVIVAVLASVVLSLLSAFFILMARDIVAYALIILSPIAVVCATFEPFSKAFALWRKTLLTILLSIPAVAAVLAASKVAAIIAMLTRNEFWGAVMGLVFIGVGYAMFWTVFKSMDKVSGLISKGVQAAGVGWAQKKLADMRNNSFKSNKERLGGRLTDWRAKKYRENVEAASGEGGRLKKWWSRRAAWALNGGRYGNIEAQQAARQAAEAKAINDQIATGNDDDIRALTVDSRLLSAPVDNVRKRRNEKTGQMEYRTLGGRWVSEENVRRAHARWGRNHHAQQAALSYEMRKASTEEEQDHIAQNFRRVAASWGMSEGQMDSAWIGAAFENQHQKLHYKRMKGKGEGAMALDNGGKALVDELYETRGSYQLSQMSSATIQALIDSWKLNNPEEAGLSDEEKRLRITQRQKIQSIAEGFAFDYGRAPSGAAPDTAEAYAGPPMPAPTPGGAPATPTAPTAPAGVAAPTPQSRTISVQGSAHTTERVSELLAITGVAYQAPQGAYATQADSTTQPYREQKTAPPEGTYTRATGDSSPSSPGGPTPRR